MDGFALDETVVVVDAPFTVSVSAADVLPDRLVLPAYTAVMECAAAVSENKVSCAELLERLAEPSEAEPSINVTVPLAVLPAGG